MDAVRGCLCYCGRCWRRQAAAVAASPKILARELKGWSSHAYRHWCQSQRLPCQVQAGRSTQATRARGCGCRGMRQSPRRLSRRCFRSCWQGKPRGSRARNLLGGAGIGMTIGANKFPGVRAALCHDDMTSEYARRQTAELFVTAKLKPATGCTRSHSLAEVRTGRSSSWSSRPRFDCGDLLRPSSNHSERRPNGQIGLFWKSTWAA